MTKQPAGKKEIFSWAMFDFANSSYTTVIVTVVFSVLFPRLIVGDAPDYKWGNLLWSLALSISYLFVVLSAPIFGAIMDYSASKKKFLFYSYLLTVISTAALFFVQPGLVTLGIILIVISNFGFSTGESFVSAFLPELGPPERLGKISGYAWGLGYFGGLFSTAIVIFGLGPIESSNFSNLRLVGPITALFFMLAAIPTFLWLKERAVARQLPEGESYLSIGFRRLRDTINHLHDFRDLAVFLLSFFFAYAGLAIIISFAFIYGDQIIKWKPITQITMFVLTQFTAAGGALLFGFIQDKIGAIRTYNITLLLWLSSVLLIYFVKDLGEILHSSLGMNVKTEQLFLVVGSLAGLGLGATQSASRALVGYLSPKSKSGEFFGFWGLFGKLSAIVGLVGLGLLQNWLGLEKAILLTALFFIIAMITTLWVDEKRGRKVAEAHEGE